MKYKNIYEGLNFEEVNELKNQEFEKNYNDIHKVCLAEVAYLTGEDGWKYRPEA